MCCNNKCYRNCCCSSHCWHSHCGPWYGINPPPMKCCRCGATHHAHVGYPYTTWTITTTVQPILNTNAVINAAVNVANKYSQIRHCL